MRKELSASEWIEEIDSGLQFRRQYGQEDSWRDLEILFYNLLGSGLGPNLIASTADSLLSMLTVPFPSINISALREEYVRSAPIVQAVDSNLMQELNIPAQVELACFHAFLWGRGILKIGYDSEFGFDPTQDIGLDTPIGPLGMTVTQFDRRGDLIESGEVKPGMPWVKACLPHDIVVPWGTHEIVDAPWVAHRVIRHIEDLRQDSKYSKTRDLEPSLSMKDFVTSYRTVLKPYRIGLFPQVRGTSEFVEIWEIHDRRTRKIIVVAADKMIRNDVDALQLEGLPFVSFSFVPASRNFWVTPDAFYLKQPQGELDDISVQASKQRRISVAKLLANRSAFTAEEAEKLVSPDVGAIIMVEDGLNPKDAVVPFQAPPNVFLYNDADYVRRNAREAVGLSRNQQGEYEQRGRRTATEVMTVDAGAARRLARRQVILRRTYEETFRKLNQIVFAFWQASRVVQITGSKGESWERFSGPDIQGEYAYKVTFSEEAPTDQTSPKESAMQLYAALSQDPTINQAALRQYLVEAFDDPLLEKVFMGGSNAGVPVSMPGMPETGGAA